MTATLVRRPPLPAPVFHGIPLVFGDVVTAVSRFGIVTALAVRVWGRKPDGRQWVAGDCGRSVLASEITCVERDGVRL